MDATTERVMTRERMRALQAVPKNPILRHHSCVCGHVGDPKFATTNPMVRGSKEGEYLCARCGRVS